MKKIIFALALGLLMSGCVSVKYNGPSVKTTPIDRPEIGKVVEASIGDPLLEKGMVVEVNVLEVYEKMGGFNYTIPPLKYQQIGFDETNDFFSAQGVTKNPLSDPIKALSVNKNNVNELCVITEFGSPVCYSGNFKKATKISEHGNSSQQTLLYSGRVGDKLKISYREFSNNTARPAFNNDVEYDFSTSKTIAYKGALLEVINADNTSITYKVIRNFK